MKKKLNTKFTIGIGDNSDRFLFCEKYLWMIQGDKCNISAEFKNQVQKLSFPKISKLS